MFRTLSLIVPVLVPSWRFFSAVAPSPRIEIALLGPAQEAAKEWREFRPRPARLSLVQSLRSLFWNPRWNEGLFLTSCAERFLSSGSQAAFDHILQRVSKALHEEGVSASRFQLRLIVIARIGQDVERHEMHRSPICDIALAPFPASRDKDDV